MKKIVPAAVMFFIGAFLPGCEDAIQKPLHPETLDLVVVSGTLTNENIEHVITLSRPYQTLNGVDTPVTGATVTISDDTNVVALTESPTGSGKYLTPPMVAITGKTYTLFILYQGQQYTAHDSATPVEAMTPLAYTKTTDGYSLVLNPVGQDPNYIEHDLSWAGTPACTSGSCNGEVVFYDLKTFDVNQIFKPSKADFYFPLNTVVIRKKYSVSPGYLAFLRGVLSETEWSGGIFDIQHANAPTNLSAGAIGFFAVSTVVSDTTVIR